MRSGHVIALSGTRGSRGGRAKLHLMKLCCLYYLIKVSFATPLRRRPAGNTSPTTNNTSPNLTAAVVRHSHSSQFTVVLMVDGSSPNRLQLFQ
eukprot:scaffold2480_cov205-Alexandrium_tamarense.AAC.20